jgi:hypothetical protein
MRRISHTEHDQIAAGVDDRERDVRSFVDLRHFS